MRLLDSEKQQVASVAARWKRQYYHNGEWGPLMSGDAQIVHGKLAALDPDATAADVAAIIGNASWIGENCNECGERNAVILVGDEPDYESATVLLCAACAKRVAALVPRKRKK